MIQARQDLADLVSFRSVADGRQFPAEECVKTAELVRDLLAGVGLFDARLIPAGDDPPVVYAHKPAASGAPTVLLYSHYDVQPPLDEQAWRTPAWELTERSGRWYGRGASDCKGNIVMQLTALRALGGAFPAGLTVVCEGAEEQGGRGLPELVSKNPGLFSADAIIICDTGNVEIGLPTVTTTLRGMADVMVTVRALASPVHSGTFGGAAPDPMTALIAMLATLHDEQGNTTIDGLARGQRWTGAEYPSARFRSDVGALPAVQLAGDGAVADMLWARPAVTVIGIDCPPVVGSAPTIQAQVRARLNLRIPPGQTASEASGALLAQLRSAAPLGVEVDISCPATAEPFAAATDGPAYHALGEAMLASFGRPLATIGQGGSIPVCNAFAEQHPDAEIILIGVEEPLCLIHAPNESVEPAEIERLALALALFLTSYQRDSQ
jgi:cysteinylglycine-S-conjugate dipeptidase